MGLQKNIKVKLRKIPLGGNIVCIEKANKIETKLIRKLEELEELERIRAGKKLDRLDN